MPALGPHPLVFQINARQLTLAVQQAARQPAATLADVPEAWLKKWAREGFNALWICGVWQTGEAGRQVALTHPDVLKMYDELLPNWTGADVAGSPYAISAYRVHADFGGDAALAALRKRMSDHGLLLILDFVPNHTARDHHWVKDHPEYYIHLSEAQYLEDPDRAWELDEGYLAYGRDPYFPSWTDTLQLDYTSSTFRTAMIDQIVAVSHHCDGLRCDMAMLVLNDVIRQTWGREVPHEEGEFWARATDAVRAARPDFRFYAEAYWGTEGRLHWLGFDATYHKSLYDHLRDHQLDALHGQLGNAAELKHSLVFLENHDEPRAVHDFPNDGYRRAALTLTLALPCVRLVHDGQAEGRCVRHAIQLARRAEETPNQEEAAFYDLLYAALKKTSVGTGQCRVLPTQSVGDNDGSFVNIAALLWCSSDNLEGAALVVINLSEQDSLARLPVHARSVAGRTWKLNDLLSPASYVRDGDELAAPGLFLKMSPHQAQVFHLSRT